MTQWVQNLWLSCLVAVLLTKTCASNTAPCAASGRYCAPQATCEQEGCVCPPGTKGNPYLYCFPEDLEVCVIGGEQQLVTFDGWRGYLPTPCNYYAAYFSSDANPECSGSVSAVNSDEPIRGRYFVKAVKVNFYTQTGATSSYYTNDDTISNAGQDPLAEVWHKTGPVRSDVLTTYDPVTRTTVLTLPACNITVAFTSVNVSLDQPLARYPGLVLGVSPDLINEDIGFPDALCSSPSEVLTNQYPPYSLGIYGVLRYYNFGFSSFPGECCIEACEEASNLMRSSCGENYIDKVATCGPILAKPSLASCLPAPIMDTFNACLRCVCLNDIDACNQLQTLADESCPELATNLTMIC